MEEATFVIAIIAVRIFPSYSQDFRPLGVNRRCAFVKGSQGDDAITWTPLRFCVGYELREQRILARLARLPSYGK